MTHFRTELISLELQRRIFGLVEILWNLADVYDEADKLRSIFEVFISSPGEKTESLKDHMSTFNAIYH